MTDTPNVETPDPAEVHSQALKYLEEFLTRTTTRQMFSATELQNLALDLHNILDPVH